MLGKRISKIKNGITQVGRMNLHMREPNLARSTSVIGRAVTLISWLRLQQRRSVPHTTAPKELMDMKALERCP